MAQAQWARCASASAGIWVFGGAPYGATKRERGVCQNRCDGRVRALATGPSVGVPMMSRSV
eukprot:510037-Pyramimonas_sp.AAC.1